MRILWDIVLSPDSLWASDKHNNEHYNTSHSFVDEFPSVTTKVTLTLTMDYNVSWLWLVEDL